MDAKRGLENKKAQKKAQNFLSKVLTFIKLKNLGWLLHKKILIAHDIFDIFTFWTQKISVKFPILFVQ